MCFWQVGLQDLCTRGTKFLLKGWHPFKRLNDSLSSPIWISLIIWNLKIFKVCLFTYSFSLLLHEFPPLSLYLSFPFSLIHKSIHNFPSPHLFHFLSTIHPPFSLPLLILFPLPSFQYSSSFPSLFSLKERRNQEGDLNFVPVRSHQLRIYIKILSFLSFCVIDHPF